MRTTVRILTPTVVATALAAIAAALWLAPPGTAVEDPDEKAAPLGLVGMTTGRVLRLSVAYVTGFDPQPDPPRCVLQVGFADGSGAAIGNPHILELHPGESRSFDHIAIGNPNIREYVRPVVSEVTPRTDCPAVVTGELLEPDRVAGIIIYDNQPVAPSAFGGRRS